MLELVGVAMDNCILSCAYNVQAKQEERARDAASTGLSRRLKEAESR
jgi:hypothetical protein